MLIFLLFVVVVLSSAWSWVWLRLVWAPHFPAPLFYFLTAVAIGSFALQFLRFARGRFKAPVWMERVGNTFFGLFVMLFFAALAKDAILLLLSFAGVPQSDALEQGAAGVTILLVLLGQYWGIRTALAGPRIREVEVPLPHWPANHPEVRLVQISDLHVGSYIKEPYVTDVVEKALALRPDVIAVTGDMGDGNVFELQKDLEPLRRLTAPHGVFYVAGNHEYYWAVQTWVAKVKDLGFTVLENSGLWIEGLQLWMGGVPDISAPKMVPGSESNPLKAAPSEAVKGPKILLAHQPKSIFGAEAAGFDLMLSGHTHSGQFFPANLIVRFFNPYHHGLYRHKAKMWVYVNAGTGFWGSPLRLFVPAEITLMRLVPQKG